MSIQAFPQASRYKTFRGSDWDSGWKRLPLAVLETPSGGDWNIETDSSKLTVSPGELLVIRPDTAHRLHTAESPQMRSSWLIIYWEVNGNPLRMKPGCKVIRNKHACMKLHTITRLMSRSPSLKARALVYSYALSLLADISDFAVLESFRDERIERALTFIQTHLNEPVSCEDLA
ncbi:MAG: hypothetical protein GF372_14655, partial [Candidatus Marinimicrobia bacterium]|nr:hypothetical protein [Candidatus Neomarinimicrobiota bacterium]